MQNESKRGSWPLTLFQSLITRSKKRRISEREDFEEMFRTSQSNRREIEDEDSLAVAISCAAVATVSSRKSAAPRRPVINRQQQKGYRNWSVAHFKARVRVNRDTFEYILEEIRPDIIKTPPSARIEAYASVSKLVQLWSRLPLLTPTRLFFL